MDCLFCIEDLDVGYDDVLIHDININVHKKSLNAILCPNNCGKSTLIKTFSGIVLPKRGNITLNNIKYSKNNFKKYMKNFGVVFEDFYDLYLGDQVIDELIFPLAHLEYSSKKIKNRVDYISKVLNITDILHRNISNLSLYEKVLVSIASSIVHLPKILFIDDILKYFNNSDRENILLLFNHIINELDISIIFTTSSVIDVKDISNVYVIGDYKIKMEGDFKSIIKMDNELTKLGFEIPLMVDLSRKLEFYNLVDEIYYSPDEVIDKLWN